MDQNDPEQMRDVSALARILATRALLSVRPRDMKDRDAIAISLGALAGAYVQLCADANVSLEDAVRGIYEAWPVPKESK